MKLFYFIFFFSLYINPTLICENKFLNFLNETNHKEILLIEKYNYHGECLPGFIKYFLDLGYKNIDVLINNKLNKQNPLKLSFLQNKINILSYNTKLIEKFILLGICNFYKICFFNTLEFGNNYKIRKYLYQKTKFKKLIVFHELNNINKKDIYFFNIIVLKKFNNNIPIYEVNPHYFGEYLYHNKSLITNFITVGTTVSFRKNFDILIECIKKLIKNNIVNFHVTIIGKGNIGKKIKKISYKKNFSNYITITGRISYDKMYQYVSKADFFLPLLDPDKHKKYITEKTSGSFQLVYGFNIPMLIEKKIADIYGFNNLNSVIYNTNNDFFNKIKYSINMRNEEYNNLKYNLNIKSKEIKKNSIKNLKIIFNK
jgi:hypothetical protein